MVFNDGAFEVPCDQELFDSVISYLSKNSEAAKPPPRLAVLPSDFPKGAGVFSAEDLPPPPAEPEPEEEEEESEDDRDWAGASDDADDGVGQL